MRRVQYETGIEIWDGLPGSGKSYSAVEFLVKRVLQERRPVYTNLPIRLRMLRRYVVLKSGKAILAKYVQVLTREHFERFATRNQLLSDFMDTMKAQGWTQKAAERAFDQAEGKGKITGPEADWLPPGAVLILDEFHRWADQRLQKNENPAFLTYATMHRHHMHRVIILTQDKMQVSLPWRRNCVKVVHCTDKRQLPFMFGLRLPIPAFAYEEWPAEYADSKDHGQMRPTATRVVVPWLSGGVIWRLYDSFTHMGSYRGLTRKLEQVRKDIEGEDYKPEEPENVTMKGKRGWGMPVLVVVLLGLLIVPKIGGCVADGISAIRGGGVKPAAPPAASVSPVTAAERLEKKREVINEQKAIEDEPVEPMVSVVGDEYVIAEGRVVSVGGELRGWKLVGVSGVDGGTLWQRGDALVPVPLGGGVRESPAVARVGGKPKRPFAGGGRALDAVHAAGSAGPVGAGDGTEGVPGGPGPQ